MNLRYNGQRVGFGDLVDEEIMKKHDPLYACHNDTFVKLKVFGAVVVTAAVTAGTILYVVPFMKSELRKRT